MSALLYYAISVNTKILIRLSDIVSQQAAATEKMNEVTKQLLDYVAIYPNYGITYRSSEMILAGHSDAAYLNVSKARS